MTFQCLTHHTFPANTISTPIKFYQNHSCIGIATTLTQRLIILSFAGAKQQPHDSHWQRLLLQMHPLMHPANSQLHGLNTSAVTR